MKGLDIKEISGDLIKRTLQEVVEKRLGSKDIEIWIEPGSKKGNNQSRFKYISINEIVSVFKQVIISLEKSTE